MYLWNRDFSARREHRRARGGRPRRALLLRYLTRPLRPIRKLLDGGPNRRREAKHRCDATSYSEGQATPFAYAGGENSNFCHGHRSRLSSSNRLELVTTTATMPRIGIDSLLRCAPDVLFL